MIYRLILVFDVVVVVDDDDDDDDVVDVVVVANSWITLFCSVITNFYSFIQLTDRLSNC